MNCIGKKVNHKKFGAGEIVLNENGKILVKFEGKNMKFSYPDAFDSFLTAEDEELQEHIKQDLAKKQELEEQRQNKIEEAVRKVTENRKHINNTAERFNVAFKCNYCNGCTTSENRWFDGVCSDENIKYNVEIAKRVWCSDKHTPCRQYLEGKISRAELCDRLNNGEFVCYESTMLRDWKASAGRITTGINRGKPKKLLNVQTNSLAILTTRKPHDDESKRFIFAVFLVTEKFEGDEKNEGYVTTNSKWKISLTPEEAVKISFWRYHINGNAPGKIAFNSGLHRTVKDGKAVQILRDIISVKEKQSEKKFAKEFLEHYCNINGINESDVPRPNGALVRMNS